MQQKINKQEESMQQTLDPWKNFSKMDKRLARLIGTKEKTQLMSTRKKWGNIITDPRILTKYNEQLCGNNFNNFDEMENSPKDTD